MLKSCPFRGPQNFSSRATFDDRPGRNHHATLAMQAICTERNAPSWRTNYCYSCACLWLWE